LQNIKPIDVANDGWTSRGHCEKSQRLCCYPKFPGFDKLIGIASRAEFEQRIVWRLHVA
jgi:hypothetical protein